MSKNSSPSMKKRALLTINLSSNAKLSVAMSTIFTLDIADLLAAHEKGKVLTSNYHDENYTSQVVRFTAK